MGGAGRNKQNPYEILLVERSAMQQSVEGAQYDKEYVHILYAHMLYTQTCLCKVAGC